MMLVMIIPVVLLISTTYLFCQMGNSYPAAHPLSSAGSVATSIFDFSVMTIDNGSVSLSTYKGKKAYLLVNVASK
jgi:hypothetical protein